jgi:hypothetical protein
MVMARSLFLLEKVTGHSPVSPHSFLVATWDDWANNRLGVDGGCSSSLAGTLAGALPRFIDRHDFCGQELEISPAILKTGL